MAEVGPLRPRRPKLCSSVPIFGSVFRQKYSTLRPSRPIEKMIRQTNSQKKFKFSRLNVFIEYVYNRQVIRSLYHSGNDMVRQFRQQPRTTQTFAPRLRDEELCPTVMTHSDQMLQQQTKVVMDTVYKQSLILITRLWRQTEQQGLDKQEKHEDVCTSQASPTVSPIFEYQLQ